MKYEKERIPYKLLPELQISSQVRGWEIRDPFRGVVFGEGGCGAGCVNSWVAWSVSSCSFSPSPYPIQPIIMKQINVTTERSSRFFSRIPTNLRDIAGEIHPPNSPLPPDRPLIARIRILRHPAPG
jgi:hypothetical protein